MAHANAIYSGQHPTHDNLLHHNLELAGTYDPRYSQPVNTYTLLHHNLQLAGTYDPRYSQPISPVKDTATPSSPSPPQPNPEEETIAEDEELRPGEALNIASALIKNVLMESDFAMENPEEGEVIERFLQDLLNNLPTIE